MSLRSRHLLLAAALCTALVACKKKDDAQDASKAAATPALTVSVMPVATREIANALVVSGPVAAVEEMQLGVEVSGLRVTRLGVDVGQRVARGQVLLTLDHRMLDAQLQQANANLRQAQAGATLASANLTRGANLAESKFISASQLDQLRAAKQQADAQLATAQAARDTVALQRSFAELRAPDSGIISKRLVQPGQIVAAGTPLLLLIRDGRLEWRAELPAAQLARVQVGDRIALKTREGTAVEGRVRAVSPGVDAATRTGTVYADLPHPEGLRPGTFLQGQVESGQVQALVVPAAAIVLRDGFPTVFTLDAQQRVHAARVETGSREAGQVEVKTGLKAGDQVVIEGAGFLAENDLVRVVPASATAVATPAAATAL